MATAGQRTKWIAIEQAIVTADDQGGRSTAWSTRCELWARERALNGREALVGQQFAAVLSSVWEIPYRDDVRVTDRIRFGARTLQIEAVLDPVGNRRELHLTCSEVQA